MTNQPKRRGQTPARLKTYPKEIYGLVHYAKTELENLLRGAKPVEIYVPGFTANEITSAIQLLNKLRVSLRHWAPDSAWTETINNMIFSKATTLDASDPHCWSIKIRFRNVDPTWARLAERNTLIRDHAETVDIPKEVEPKPEPEEFTDESEPDPITHAEAMGTKPLTPRDEPRPLDRDYPNYLDNLFDGVAEK